MNKHKKWKSKINRTKDQIKFSLCFIQFLQWKVGMSFGIIFVTLPRLVRLALAYDIITRPNTRKRTVLEKAKPTLDCLRSILGKTSRASIDWCASPTRCCLDSQHFDFLWLFRETMNPVATKFVWICFVAASFVFRFAFQSSKEIVFRKVAWSAQRKLEDFATRTQAAPNSVAFDGHLRVLRLSYLETLKCFMVFHTFLRTLMIVYGNRERKQMFK